MSDGPLPRTSPFIGRAAELRRVMDVAQEAVESRSAKSVGLHFHAAEAVGKTALSQRATRALAETERLMPIPLTLNSPGRHDPFQRLLDVRRLVGQRDASFECVAFDFAVLLYAQKYRSGAIDLRALKGSPFDIKDLFVESITDALKAGTEKALEEVRQIAAVSGAVGSSSSLTATVLAAAATKAVMIGVIAASAAGSVVLVRSMMRAAKSRSIRHGVFVKYPDLQRFLDAYDDDHDGLEAMLPILLGDALAASQDQPHAWLPCLLLDPADCLGAQDEDEPALAVGRAVATVFKRVDRKMVMSTAREPMNAFFLRATHLCTLPSCDVEEFPLLPLPRADVEEWLADQRAFSDSLPPSVLTPDGEFVMPIAFAAWWKTAIQKGDPDTKASDISESETV